MSSPGAIASTPFHFQILPGSGASLIPTPTTVETSTDRFVVGNRRVFEQMMGEVRQRRTTPIAVDESLLCQLQVPITSRRPLETGGLALLLLSATIMIEPGETSETLSWLLTVPRRPTADQILSDPPLEDYEHTVVVDMSRIPGREPGLEIVEGDPIRYRKKNLGTGGWDELVAQKVEGRRPRPQDPESEESEWERTEAIIRSALDLHAYITNRDGFASAEWIINTAVKLEFEQSNRSVERIFDVLRPLYGELKRIHEELNEDPSKRAFYEGRDAVLMKRFRVFMREASKRFGGKEAGREADLANGITAAYSQAAEAFSWRGRRMTPKAFRGALTTLEDSQERRALLTAYSQAILAGHRSPGGLFEAIPELNRLARAEGYAHHLDKRYHLRFGISAEEMKREIEDYLARTAEENRLFIEKLKRITGVSEVTEADIHFLVQKAILIEGGLSARPTLTPQRIAEGVQRFYEELGYGSTLGPLYLDMSPREGKHGHDGYVPLDAESGAFIVKNYPEICTLREVEELVHELAHRAHFAVGGRAFGGDAFLVSYSPNDLREGIADGIAQAFVSNEEVLRRYFPELPSEYRKAFVRWNRRFFRFRIRQGFGIALAELGLYEERTSSYSEWVARHLHLTPPRSEEGGYAFTAPHLGMMIGGFPAYPRGMIAFQEAFEPLVAAVLQGPEAIARTKGPVERLFRAGGLIRDLEEARNLLREER